MRLVFIIVLFFTQPLFSQYTVKMAVVAPQGSDKIFIAGSFNNWNPTAAPLAKANGNDTFYFSQSNVPTANYEYKFTRGNWDKVETQLNGVGIANRQLLFTSDTSIILHIANWKDNFATPPKLNTASKQVQLLDTVFTMKALQRPRKVWVYLPPGYQTSATRYPVIYMHDGQNLFNEATAPFGEWGIDETLDSLAKAGKPGAIIVGIENGEKRMNEYNPYFFERAGAGEGDAYLQFIIQELKPFIDKKFRTKKDKDNTVIAGSSMGGLISYYAAIKYPGVFGRAGVFSPAFWTAPQINLLTDSLAPNLNGMYFFYMGEKEGKEMLYYLDVITQSLGKSSSALLYFITDKEGQHNEAAWRKWFAEFYTWITGNGLNKIVR